MMRLIDIKVLSYLSYNYDNYLTPVRHLKRPSFPKLPNRKTAMCCYTRGTCTQKTWKQDTWRALSYSKPP